jgi:hypothetical protein
VKVKSKQAIALLLTGAMLAVSASPASALPSKKRTMSFKYEFLGACDDLEFTEEEYNAGQKCQISIWTYPKKPKRTMKLQWWSDNSGKWVTETSKKTNKKGRTKLTVSPICSDGTFCDGSFEFQIYSPKSGKYRPMWSYDTFDIYFTPIESEEELVEEPTEESDEL